MAIDLPKLLCPGKILCGPSKQPLDVLGRNAVQLRYSIRHHVYIVQSLNQNLLGLPVILALNIISRLGNLNTTSAIPSQIPCIKG